MKNNKRYFLVALIALVTCCFCLFGGCAPSIGAKVNDSVLTDRLVDRVSFDKKYYYLGYDGLDKNQYYAFLSDGTATYTHIIKENNKTTFHQVINFLWTYAGDGNCVLVHNGTKVITGTQDDAFGFSKVFSVNKDVVYWSASGENTYYVCEDFANNIGNYGKFVNY